MAHETEGDTVKNADYPAFPHEWKHYLPNGGDVTTTTHGLSKRELFAKDLLCSLLSNSPQSQMHGFPEYIGPNHIEEMPKIALAYADALLLELAK